MGEAFDRAVEGAVRLLFRTLRARPPGGRVDHHVAAVGAPEVIEAVHELHQRLAPAGGQQVHRVGQAQGDLLQGHAITLKPGESWLLLIRVVDISGNTNLMTEVGGAERWDSGIPDGPGSGVAADRYLDCKGNTPGTTDHAFNAWVVADKAAM